MSEDAITLSAQLTDVVNLQPEFRLLASDPYRAQRCGLFAYINIRWAR